MKKELEKLYRQQNRIAESIQELEHRRSDMCWGCDCTGPTTDLVECEVGNINYPYRCEDENAK